MTASAANDNAPGTSQPWRRICARCGVEMTVRDTPQCWDCLHADDVVSSPKLDSLWVSLLGDVGKTMSTRLRDALSRIGPPPDHRRW